MEDKRQERGGRERGKREGKREGEERGEEREGELADGPFRPCSELQLRFCRRLSATSPCRHRTVGSIRMAELGGHRMGS